MAMSLRLRPCLLLRTTRTIPIRSLSSSSFPCPPRSSLLSASAPPRLLFCPSSTRHRQITLQAQPPTHPPEDWEPLEPGEGDTIDLTDSAIKQIVRAQTLSSDPSLALRVAVESGGCHGYQYKMEVTNRREEDDYLFIPPSSPARLLIDSSSLPLLAGSTIDYATELIGSSFRVTGNPHASDKGGCGCGVSWELKE